jgi:hypothetical protein
VLRRAGVIASPIRVAQAYLELAIVVRALEGLAAEYSKRLPVRSCAEGAMRPPRRI